MKKLLLKDISSFRTWQFDTSKGLDSAGQRAVSTVSCPSHFPVLLVFEFTQTIDTFDSLDKLEYVYVYIGDFPVKEVKTGIYIYQVVKTNERFLEMMEH